MNVDMKLNGSRVEVRFPYSPIILERLRTVPGRRWNPEGKFWSIPAVRDCLLMVMDISGMLPEMLPADLRGIVGGEEEEEEVLDMSEVDKHEFLTEPYGHQRKNLARLLSHTRWLLADECGTGKSHPVCNALMLIRDVSQLHYNILIVCPKSVKSSWAEQLETHVNLNYLGVEGTKKQRQEILSGDYPIRIANYEQLLHNNFEKTQWNVIIFDEIHRLKNFAGKISRIARRLSAKAIAVYGLSGTPAPNGLQDWHGVLAALDPEGVPWKTKGAFEESFCYKSRLKGDGPFVISGYRNVGDLRKIVKKYVSRTTKEEALDLPPKVFETRSQPLQGEQKRIYNELRKNAVARLSVLETEGTLTAANVLTESLRLLQIVGGFVPDDDGAMHEIDEKSKVDMLWDCLDEIGNKQVVIWTAFRAEANWLAEYLGRKLRCTVSLLSGETSTSDRLLAIEDFRKGNSRFFVGTAAAGGTGVNGLQVADTAIFYSRNYNLTDYLQAQDRTHRIGTENKVTIFNLIAQGTIDEKVHEALERKASLQEMMLGRKIEDIL